MTMTFRINEKLLKCFENNPYRKYYDIIKKKRE